MVGEHVMYPIVRFAMSHIRLVHACSLVLSSLSLFLRVIWTRFTHQHLNGQGYGPSLHYYCRYTYGSSSCLLNGLARKVQTGHGRTSSEFPSSQRIVLHPVSFARCPAFYSQSTLTTTLHQRASEISRIIRNEDYMTL
ncbi:hypothetical protein L226DRAFT_219913 [Lentinus tigrinus ALCF2SS1-7]|uniref:uncharacterized protein n=1 Tax=Lentinus tigrinus ALCF2SS1-7 TaxID=1328758 RepID=UPI0011660F91|nr:hypothetical protein L226DRAFT_219913 [Lentinus tigrinus ALCF2SS1-7]